MSDGSWKIYNDTNNAWQSLSSTTEVTKKIPVLSPIAQVPSAGYAKRDNYSKASIQWLEYQMELARRNGVIIKIQHALNGGEEHILGTHYKVDGLSDRTVYEYHGMLFINMC